MAPILPDHYADWPLWTRLLHRLIRLFCRGVHRLRADPSTVPDQGPVVLVANHHAGPDPLFLQATNRRLISWMIAEEYYQAPFLRRLYERIGAVSVARSRPSKDTFKGILDRLRQGRVAGVFPEGGIHLPGQRVKPKRGAALMALETGATVIPARIRGIQQLPGADIKTFLRPRRVTVSYGEPVDLSDLRERYGGDEDRAILDSASERILEAIYAL
jgi:1-acyl-sn-glycerol-3-phosphate acyltransferase